MEITSNITCQDTGIYLLACKKDTGQCARVSPIYIGECGSGPNSSFTHRLSTHIGSAIQPSQAETIKPVGRHFRMPGHLVNSHIFCLPIENISDDESFLRKARESFFIKKFKALKHLSINEIEHGLNLNRGQ